MTEPLDERFPRCEDIQAIRELKYPQMDRVDAGDAAGVAELLAADAAWLLARYYDRYRTELGTWLIEHSVCTQESTRNVLHEARAVPST